MNLVLFCPECGEYVRPFDLVCPNCGTWKRQKKDEIPGPGEPFWKVEIGMPVCGKPLIVGDLVIFSAGSRKNSQGRVVAINRLTGEIVKWKGEELDALKFPVEAPLLLAGKRVLFTTTGFLDGGAQLFCLDVENKKVLWRKDLPGGSYTRLVTANHDSVFVATENGSLNGFLIETGVPIEHYPQPLPKGKAYVHYWERSLVVFCENGEMKRLDLARATSMMNQIPLQGRLTSEPAFCEGKYYFGLEGGRLAMVDLREQKFEVISEGHKKISAAPLVKGHVIYFGDWTHHLNAYDLHQGKLLWKADCTHSVNTTPCVENDLVFVGANDGAIHAFDCQNGRRVWRYAVGKSLERPESSTAVLCSPVCAGGMIFAGADDGNATALPWHLGQYDWAANWMDQHGSPEDSACLFAIASTHENSNLRHQGDLRNRAIQRWQDYGRPDLAAIYRGACLGELPLDQARHFREAALLFGDKDAARAAHCLRRAMEIFEDAEAIEEASDCEKMAIKIGNAPYLVIRILNEPSGWQAEKEHHVRLEIKNRGNYPAKGVAVRITGTMQTTDWQKKNAIFSNDLWEVDFILVPEVMGKGFFVVEVVYFDNLEKKWTNHKRREIDEILKAKQTMTVKGSVGWMENNQQPDEINIEGNVGFLQMNGQEETPPEAEEGEIECPHCHENTPPGPYCNYCGKELPAV